MSDNPPLPPFDSPPWPVSRQERWVSLTGKVMPWREGWPDLLRMFNSPDMYAPAYSTAELLYEMHQDDGNLVVKLIQDGNLFMADLPYWYSPGVRLRVILNPHRTPRGTIRFAEVQREEPKLLSKP